MPQHSLRAEGGCARVRELQKTKVLAPPHMEAYLQAVGDATAVAHDLLQHHVRHASLQELSWSQPGTRATCHEPGTLTGGERVSCIGTGVSTMRAATAARAGA